MINGTWNLGEYLDFIGRCETNAFTLGKIQALNYYVYCASQEPLKVPTTSYLTEEKPIYDVRLFQTYNSLLNHNYYCCLCENSTICIFAQKQDDAFLDLFCSPPSLLQKRSLSDFFTSDIYSSLVQCVKNCFERILEKNGFFRINNTLMLIEQKKFRYALNIMPFINQVNELGIIVNRDYHDSRYLKQPLSLYNHHINTYNHGEKKSAGLLVYLSPTGNKATLTGSFIYSDDINETQELCNMWKKYYFLPETWMQIINSTDSKMIVAVELICEYFNDKIWYPSCFICLDLKDTTSDVVVGPDAKLTKYTASECDDTSRMIDSQKMKVNIGDTAVMLPPSPPASSLSLYKEGSKASPVASFPQLNDSQHHSLTFSVVKKKKHLSSSALSLPAMMSMQRSLPEACSSNLTNIYPVVSLPEISVVYQYQHQPLTKRKIKYPPEKFSKESDIIRDVVGTEGELPKVLFVSGVTKSENFDTLSEQSTGAEQQLPGDNTSPVKSSSHTPPIPELSTTNSLPPLPTTTLLSAPNSAAATTMVAMSVTTPMLAALVSASSIPISSATSVLPNSIPGSSTTSSSSVVPHPPLPAPSSQVGNFSKKGKKKLILSNSDIALSLSDMENVWVNSDNESEYQSPKFVERSAGSNYPPSSGYFTAQSKGPFENGEISIKDLTNANSNCSFGAATGAGGGGGCRLKILSTFDEEPPKSLTNGKSAAVYGEPNNEGSLDSSSHEDDIIVPIYAPIPLRSAYFIKKNPKYPPSYHPSPKHACKHPFSSCFSSLYNNNIDTDSNEYNADGDGEDDSSSLVSVNKRKIFWSWSSNYSVIYSCYNKKQHNLDGMDSLIRSESSALSLQSVSHSIFGPINLSFIMLTKDYSDILFYNNSPLDMDDSFSSIKKIIHDILINTTLDKFSQTHQQQCSTSPPSYQEDTTFRRVVLGTKGYSQRVHHNSSTSTEGDASMRSDSVTNVVVDTTTSPHTTTTAISMNNNSSISHDSSVPSLSACSNVIADDTTALVSDLEVECTLDPSLLVTQGKGYVEIKSSDLKFWELSNLSPYGLRGSVRCLGFFPSEDHEQYTSCLKEMMASYHDLNLGEFLIWSETKIDVSNKKNLHNTFYFSQAQCQMKSMASKVMGECYNFSHDSIPCNSISTTVIVIFDWEVPCASHENFRYWLSRNIHYRLSLYSLFNNVDAWKREYFQIIVIPYHFLVNKLTQHNYMRKYVLSKWMCLCCFESVRVTPSSSSCFSSSFSLSSSFCFSASSSFKDTNLCRFKIPDKMVIVGKDCQGLLDNLDNMKNLELRAQQSQFNPIVVIKKVPRHLGVNIDWGIFTKEYKAVAYFCAYLSITLANGDLWTWAVIADECGSHLLFHTFTCSPPTNNGSGVNVMNIAFQKILDFSERTARSLSSVYHLVLFPLSPKSSVSPSYNYNSPPSNVGSGGGWYIRTQQGGGGGGTDNCYSYYQNLLDASSYIQTKKHCQSISTWNVTKIYDKLTLQAQVDDARPPPPPDVLPTSPKYSHTAILSSKKDLCYSKPPYKAELHFRTYTVHAKCMIYSGSMFTMLGALFPNEDRPEASSDAAEFRLFKHVLQLLSNMTYLGAHTLIQDRFHPSLPHFLQMGFDLKRLLELTLSNS